MKLSNLPVIFLDCQTSGSTPVDAQIIEMSWSLGDLDYSTFCQLEDGTDLPARIASLTGITREQLDDGIELPDLYKKIKLLNPKGDIPLVIHFAQFELRFLKDLFQENDDEFDWQVYCTHKISKRFYPDIPSRGIRGLAGYLEAPIGDFKRSSEHIDATRHIWNCLTKQLKLQGVEKTGQLQEWLLTSKAPKREKFSYPLKSEIRLSLPKEPGIYRMLNSKNKIIYVGKAANLHSRVNSYFRGQKTKAGNKMEMLSQVWDVDYTICKSPLEAALVETDEIKKHNPPYNVALKKDRRGVSCYDKNLREKVDSAKELSYAGPFPAAEFLAPLQLLSLALKEHRYRSEIFFIETEEDNFLEGLKLFEEQHQIERDIGCRSLLSLGLSLIRYYDEGEDDEEEEDQPEDLDDTEELVEPLQTPESVCSGLNHIIRYSARLYWRSIWLNRLANCQLYYKEPKGSIWYQITFTAGTYEKIVSLKKTAPKNLLYPEKTHPVLWDVQTYDRLRTVLTELWRVLEKGGKIKLCSHEGYFFSEENLQCLWRI